MIKENDFLTVVVASMFKYYDTYIDTLFKNDVYNIYKKIMKEKSNCSDLDIEKMFGNSNFVKLLNNDEYNDIVFEDNEFYWANVTVNEILHLQ